MEYLNKELNFLQFKSIKNISISIYECLDFSVIFALKPSYTKDISIEDIVKLNNILFKYKWKVNIYQGLYGRFVELKRLGELTPPVFNNIKELYIQADLGVKTQLNFIVLDDIEDVLLLSQNEIHIFFHRISEYGNSIPDLIRPAYERLAKRINDPKLYEYSNNHFKGEIVTIEKDKSMSFVPLEYLEKVSKHSMYEGLIIKDLKFRGNKMIVTWQTGAKTIITHNKETDPEFDLEKAIYAAITKRVLTHFGTNSHERSMNELIAKATDLYKKDKIRAKEIAKAKADRAKRKAKKQAEAKASKEKNKKSTKK